MCLPPYVIIERRSKATKSQLRPLSEASTSPMAYRYQISPRIITRAPSSPSRWVMPSDCGGSGVAVASQALPPLRKNVSSSCEETVESRPETDPLPPAATQPTVEAPNRAPSYHRRSSSVNSASARSFMEMKRNVSRIWMRLSKLEKDYERRKMEKEHGGRRWEDRFHPRLSDNRRRYRDGATRGRVRYIHPYKT